MKLILDIGGTNLRARLYDDNNNIVKSEKWLTAAHDWLKNKLEIKKFVSSFNVNSVGVGMPGPSNYEKGIFLEPYNLPGWWGINISDELREITNAKILVFENDANLMALANHNNFGLGKNAVSQFFTISTGVGAGLIIDNKIFKGAAHFAEEVGNAPTSIVQEKNSKYNQFALEYFSSGSGISMRWEKVGGKNGVVEAFAQYHNDPKAKRIIDDGIVALGNMIATTIAILNPSHIIFDGSIARHEKWYVEAALSYAEKLNDKPQFAAMKPLFSKLDDDAVILGALAMLDQKLLEANLS